MLPVPTISYICKKLQQIKIVKFKAAINLGNIIMYVSCVDLQISDLKCLYTDGMLWIYLAYNSNHLVDT